MNIDSTNIETWIKRYVLNQLDESQAEEFESYFLSHPEVIEKIDAAQKIKMGLQELESTAKATNRAAQTEFATSNERRSVIAKLLAWMTVPVPSYAMLIALAVLGPLALNNNAPKSVDSNGGIQLVRLDAPSVRSAEAAKGVDLSVDGKQAAVLVRVKSVDYPIYKLSVSHSGVDKVLWTSDIFEFASGSRDQLVVIPSHAAIANANVQLFAEDEQGGEIEVAYCNYTEACF